MPNKRGFKIKGGSEILLNLMNGRGGGGQNKWGGRGFGIPKNPLISVMNEKRHTCLILMFKLKGALSGQRQFKSPLKMMKNAFHFTSKARFVLKIFNFLS